MFEFSLRLRRFLSRSGSSSIRLAHTTLHSHAYILYSAFFPFNSRYSALSPFVRHLLVRLYRSSSSSIQSTTPPPPRCLSSPRLSHITHYYTNSGQHTIAHISSYPASYHGAIILLHAFSSAGLIPLTIVHCSVASTRERRLEIAALPHFSFAHCLVHACFLVSFSRVAC